MLKSRPGVGRSYPESTPSEPRASTGGANVSAVDDLRLAWWEQHQSRPVPCLSLMTLAVAGGGPDQPWARRGFRWISGRVARHPFAAFLDLADALDDPRMLARLDRLRLLYPPDLVAWRLLRMDAVRGPFTGRRDSVASLVDDLWPIAVRRPFTAVRIEPAPKLGVTRPVPGRRPGAALSA